jgi:hypothetical protein
MKKLKKYRVESTRDNFPTAGRHIHFLHIRAFASEGIDLTEKENSHFDVCRGCRLKLIDALRNRAPQVVYTITPKAA